ncbi:MAG: hypothetical protein ACT6S0_01010 [Roseateles sp.]|uniref:hypothetical protein n=1 Tax=Roseateles sp. TaxID=1971397 RepID=UPI0040367187
MKLVMIGDAEQPQLLQWAQQLAPRVRLAAVSSRGFPPGWEMLLPEADRLALNLPAGDVMALMRSMPRVGSWLASTDADWLHAHDVALHGSLAWASCLGWRLRARIACSDSRGELARMLGRGGSWRWLARKSLRNAALATAEEHDTATLMREHGAAQVMALPAGDPFEPHVQRFLTRLRELSP